MTKKELISKHGAKLLNDVSYFEDSLPNHPMSIKVEMIAETAEIKEEEAFEALKDYQHFIYD